MPDTSKQNTYRDKRKPGLQDVSYSNPLYNTSIVLKGVMDKFSQATGGKKKKKGK